MCTEYQNRLKSLAASFGRSLSVVELGNLKERFPYKIDTRGFDISAMGRLFAPKVLPESVERALYLDCDTIVCGSIEPLYGGMPDRNGDGADGISGNERDHRDEAGGCIL